MIEVFPTDQMPSDPESAGRRYAPPGKRAGHVERTQLLVASGEFSQRPVRVIQAPAGFGKTIFASQLCAADPRPAAWVALRDSDNDVVRLLRRIAEALEAIEAVDPGLIDELQQASPRVDALLARLQDGWLRRSALQLLLDDCHVLTSPGAVAVLRSLVDAVPAGALFVLITREDLPIGLARKRIAGEIHEIRASDLVLDESETRQLLELSSVNVGPDDLSRVWLATEGWAAAIGLVALAHAASPDVQFRRTVSGANRDLADYFHEEVLGRQPAEVQQFLLQTSLTQRLSGPLCDAITGRGDSHALLDQLVRSNLFIVPLDQDHRWYRYHHLFQDLLQLDLVRSGADTAALLDRAAAWHEERGDPGEAFDYAIRCHDMTRAGRILLRDWDTFANSGRMGTLLLWLDKCSEEEIESDPHLAIGAAWVTSQLGLAGRASRYLTVAERGDLDVAPSPDGATSLRAAMINLRGTLAPAGALQMLDDGLSLIESERPARSRRLVGAYRVTGLARLVLGDSRLAVDALEEAVLLTDGEPRDRHVRVYCLGLLALAHIDLGNWGQARQCRDEAETLMPGIERTVMMLPVLATGALLDARIGDREGAAAGLSRLRDLLPRALAAPCLRAEMALRGACAAHLNSDDRMACELIDEARHDCARVENAGTILTRIDDLVATMSPGNSALAQLTPAETRVLRQLCTHRTLQEIADHIYVSRTTVKTHVASVYLKLSVTTRDEAVGIWHASANGEVGVPDLPTGSSLTR